VPKIRQNDKLLFDFAKRLRVARLASGYDTAESFAKVLKITAPAYRKYERGETFPDIQMLRDVANITGFTLDWMLAGYGDPRRTGS
jgi:transcriptional regulator with XRE-family HTH domain